MTIYERMKENKFNPAKSFAYEVIDKKRVGRSYYIKSILCGKGGRLCSNKVSRAKRFNIGRDKINYLKTKASKAFMLEFAEFFKKEY